MARKPSTAAPARAPRRRTTKASTGSSSRRPANVSPYPDLAMAISMLEHRARHVSEERLPLINKWIAQLAKLQQEMTKLRKLEQLATSLTQPKQEKLPL